MMMRKLWMALPLAMMLGAPAVSGDNNVQLTEKEQTKLDTRLEGRTAGKPVSCIPNHAQRSMTVISDEVLIFGTRRNAKTIYVNKPYGGCRNADRNILVYSRPTSSLCRGEIVRVVDNTIGGTVDSCSFSEFVPYTKTAS